MLFYHAVSARTFIYQRPLNVHLSMCWCFPVAQASFTWKLFGRCWPIFWAGLRCKNSHFLLITEFFINCKQMTTNDGKSAVKYVLLFIDIFFYLQLFIYTSYRDLYLAKTKNLCNRSFLGGLIGRIEKIINCCGGWEVWYWPFFDRSIWYIATDFNKLWKKCQNSGLIEYLLMFFISNNQAYISYIPENL